MSRGTTTKETDVQWNMLIALRRQGEEYIDRYHANKKMSVLYIANIVKALMKQYYKQLAWYVESITVQHNVSGVGRSDIKILVPGYGVSVNGIVDLFVK